MGIILSILLAMALIYGGQWSLARYREWINDLPCPKSEKIITRFYIVLWFIMVAAAGLGVQEGTLNYGAFILPGVLALPYLIGIVIGWWKSWRYRGQRLTDKDVLKEINPIDIFRDAVIELGCKPTKNDDGTLSVSYQGENFHIEFGGMYARVWDPMWSAIKADDLELPKVREAMNAANFNFGPTVVMTAPDEEGVIGFHSRRDIMLHPACPDNVPFVKAVLDSFFDIKGQMRGSYQQLSAQQIDKKKNRRPVGFTTNQKPENSEES